MRTHICIYDSSTIDSLFFDAPIQVKYERDSNGFAYYGIAFGNNIISVRNGELVSLDDVTYLEYFSDWWIDTENNDYDTIIRQWKKWENEELVKREN